MTAICALASMAVSVDLLTRVAPPQKTACIATHQTLVVIPTVCKSGLCSTPVVAVICDKAVLPFSH
jgi:hypothetical protein